MTLKIIGAVCIIISCTAIGFSLSYRVHGRYRELTELKKILYLLSGEIKFGSSTLEEAFQTVAERSGPPYDGFFSYLSEEMQKRSSVTLAEIWRSGLETKLKPARLSKGDREILLHVGNDMGCLDKETQLKTLALAGEQLEDVRKSLYIELPKKMKLYNYLGILAGVFLTILLI